MSLNDLRDKYSIVGVGYTPQGRLPDRTVMSFYAEACANAMADAGLKKEDVDGIVLYHSFPPEPDQPEPTPYGVAQHLGMTPSGLSHETYCTRNVLFTAIGWLETGICKNVIIVYADNGRSGNFLGRTFGFHSQPAYGHLGLTAVFPLAAQRAIHEGITNGPETWKYIAVGARKWANLNPRAVMHKRTLDFNGYFNSQMLVEPFRLYDNAVINDGGRAYVVTSTERARDLRHRPAIIMGLGMHNRACDFQQLDCKGRPSGARIAGKMAFDMAGITVNDIDACELYDATTYLVETRLIDYGFFGPGEGEDWFKGGTIEPGGRMPINTSGGMLSEAYFMGVTPLTEAVMQLMGRGEDRQLGPKTGTKEPEIILCGDIGAATESEATIILRKG